MAKCSVTVDKNKRSINMNHTKQGTHDFMKRVELLLEKSKRVMPIAFETRNGVSMPISLDLDLKSTKDISRIIGDESSLSIEGSIGVYEFQDPNSPSKKRKITFPIIDSKVDLSEMFEMAADMAELALSFRNLAILAACTDEEMIARSGTTPPTGIILADLLVGNSKLSRKGIGQILSSESGSNKLSNDILIAHNSEKELTQITEIIGHEITEKFIKGCRTYAETASKVPGCKLNTMGSTGTTPVIVVRKAAQVEEIDTFKSGNNKKTSLI